MAYCDISCQCCTRFANFVVNLPSANFILEKFLRVKIYSLHKTDYYTLPNTHKDY